MDANAYGKDFLKVLNATMNAPDPRIVALLPAAYAEAHLKSLIAKRLSGANHDMREKLFESPMGLLSTLAAKLDIAKALEIIDAPTHTQGVLVARIRNRFAHEISVTDFNHPKVAELVDELAKSPKQIHAQIRHQGEWKPLLRDNREGLFMRGAFTLCISILRGHAGDQHVEITDGEAPGASGQPSWHTIIFSPPLPESEDQNRTAK